MNHVELTIQELSRQIAERQDAINALFRLANNEPTGNGKPIEPETTKSAERKKPRRAVK